MRLVALLSARVLSASAFSPDELRIGVHLPVEHQARQAVNAGAEQVVIRSDTPTAELARTVDRLSRETGIPVVLAGDGPDLARRIEKDDRILLLAAQMIVPQSALEDLIAAPPPALLVTPTEPETGHFERIDGTHVWAGAALLGGDTVLSTVDMLGEWDLELTLLRRAVQQDAFRVELPSQMAAAGRLVRVDAREDAERAMVTLSQGGFSDEGGRDGLSTLLAPIGRRIVAGLAQLKVNPDHLSWAAGLSSVLGIAVASLDWPLVALLLALFAEASLGLHRGCAQIMLRRDVPLWLRVLIKGASLTVLAVIGGRLAEGNALAFAGVGLPLALVAVQSIVDARDRRPVSSQLSLWMRLSTAMILTAGVLGALSGRMADAFILIGLCAFGTVAARMLAGDNKRN